MQNGVFEYQHQRRMTFVAICKVVAVLPICSTPENARECKRFLPAVARAKIWR